MINKNAQNNFDQDKGLIIGVGFQKTGTSSLREALKVLDYRVKDTTTRALIPILKKDYPSILRMLNSYDAVEDTPWYMIYKELDKLIPNSKFILTIRDEESWFLSVKKHTNLQAFKEQLINKSHIFLGQSGVGKSSLINSLIPDLELRINEISNKSKLGKHTTTNTTIYHIPSGGDLIDSPGVREFQLDDLSEHEIKSGFKEFKALSGECRFRDCKHINEPNCSIKIAIEKGEINMNRYQSYLNIIS